MPYPYTNTDYSLSKIISITLIVVLMSLTTETLHITIH